MHFRLPSNEPVQAAVQRIASSLIGDMVDLLEGDTSDVHQTVHGVRKRCKRARGLIRLVRPSASWYRKENGRFRDAARDLSPLRDATSLLEALDKLKDESRGKSDTEIVASARKHFQRRRKALLHSTNIEGLVSTTIDRLRAAERRLPSWELEEEGFGAVSAGLGKTYRRARRAYSAAVRKPTADRLHELRKRVKYHRFHMELLHDLSPDTISRRASDLDRLGELLGEDHDLAMLSEALDRDSEKEAGADALRSLAATRSRELRSAALPLAEVLLQDPAKQLIATLKQHWKIK